MDTFAANKRTQENEMWSRRKSQIEREKSDTKKSPRSHSEDNSEEQDPRKRAKRSHTSNYDHNRPAELSDERDNANEDEDDLENILAPQRQVRGRGGLGPRIGLTGPYLDDDSATIGVRDSLQIFLRREQGPSKPEWLKSDNDKDGRNKSVDGKSSDLERRRLQEKKEKRRKKEKKKERKEKRRKEEKKRKHKRKREHSPTTSTSYSD